MKLIKDTIKNEIVINKSRFITHIFRVNTTDEVSEYLSSIQKKYYDANHNCYAYIIGDNQEIQKCSDDGEPNKTAGFPMLDVLKKQQLTNILAITTRYFGGVLLGAGGLTRAYSSSVSEALKSQVFYKKELLNIYSVTINYSDYNLILKSNLDINILSSSFNVDVTIKFSVNENKSDEVINRITDLTKSNQIVMFIEKSYIEVVDN